MFRHRGGFFGRTPASSCPLDPAAFENSVVAGLPKCGNAASITELPGIGGLQLTHAHVNTSVVLQDISLRMPFGSAEHQTTL